jgi:FO synthase subunit 1
MADFPTVPSALVTYSPAYTVVPTYECFNRCSYCNFRVDPGRDTWVSLADAKARLRSLQAYGVIEILVLSGEVHPASPRRSKWVQHIYDLCQLALDLGFLPHTNAGPLQRDEMVKLRSVNVSMGLMLEQLTPALLSTVHRHAPSKDPQLRLQQLIWAGELEIPFTTGLLLGIGETAADRIETLEAIAQVHQQFGHIQEVILQPHSPGTRQVWEGHAFDPEHLPNVVAIARDILPEDIAIQIPPNLISVPTLVKCLQNGARDIGGIGPTDEVNPDYPHPCDRTLAEQLAAHGWQLQPRLPIYPQYDDGLPADLHNKVEQWRSRLWRSDVTSSVVATQ